MRSGMIGLASFAATVALAVWQSWDAADLAWSMWTASLVGGYAMVLASNLRPGSGRRSAGRRIGTVVVFSLHFLFFHFAHARILQMILPLAEGGTALGGLLLTCLERYWPFLAIALVRLRPVLAAGWRSSSNLRPSDPYRAVTRNHLTILATAITAQLFGESPLLYVVLVFYFFPFEAARRFLSRDRA